MAQDTLPDFHFLFIASDLGGEWLFDAAHAYWERFKPIVVSDFDVVKRVPANRSLAVTVIARPERIAQLSQLLAQFAPHALFDPIAYSYFDDAKLTLNGRADLNQPFGVPLIPSPTLPPPPTLTPTPGVPVRPPAGFVTMTPTPKKGGG